MKKILIIKIGAIGDIIMALPVITEIKRKYPDSHITWVCGNIVANLLKEVPAIDVILNVDEKKIFSANKLQALKEIAAYQSKIAFQKFDYVLNFHHDGRYKIFAGLVRADQNLHLSRNGERPTLIPARSRSFEHVRLFLQHDDNYTGNIYFPADNITAPETGPYNGSSVNLDRPFVIIAAGGAKNTLNEQELRRWPVQNYVEVAKYLQDRGIGIVLTGITSDEWVLPYFEGLQVVNLIGKLSIVELIGMMRKSVLVLTHDSGPFHLAVFAQKCFVVGLFGPTNPAEFTYGEYYDKVNVLWEGKSIFCSPCYFGKLFSTQCSNNVCMKMIGPLTVVNLIEKLLTDK